MRIAMFGAGRIAPLHGRTLVDAPGVAAVSITDVVPERAERVAAELGLEHEPSQEAALTAADAVVIVQDVLPGGTSVDLERRGFIYGLAAGLK